MSGATINGRSTGRGCRALGAADTETVALDDEAGDLVVEDHVLQQAGLRIEDRLHPLDVDQGADVGGSVAAQQDLKLAGGLAQLPLQTLQVVGGRRGAARRRRV